MDDISKIASKLGKIGGKKSVEKRFAGKTKKEISEIMKNVRSNGKQKIYDKKSTNRI